MTEKNIADATKKAGKPELKETLSMMKDQLKRYRYYKPFSFLNDQERTTDDLMKSVTAAGLLQDMATLTADLNDEQKKRKEETKEIFAAYCMNICAKIVGKWSWDGDKDKAAKVMDLLFRFPTCREDNDEKVMFVAEDWTKQPGIINDLANWLKENGGKEFHREMRKRLSSRSKDEWRKTQIERKVKDPVTGKTKRVYTPKMELENIFTTDPDTGKYDINPDLEKLIMKRAREAMLTETRIGVIQDALLTCYAKQTINTKQYDILCYHFGIGSDHGDGMSLASLAREMDEDYQYINRQYKKACDVLGKYLTDSKIWNEVI